MLLFFQLRWSRFLIPLISTLLFASAIVANWLSSALESKFKQYLGSNYEIWLFILFGISLLLSFGINWWQMQSSSSQLVKDTEASINNNKGQVNFTKTGDGSNVVNIGNIQISSTEKKNVPRQLPNLPENFVGRQAEINRIVHIIQTDISIVPIATITGMPGVGKSTLAIAAAIQLAKNYPDGQIILRTGTHSPQPLSFTQILIQCILTFAPRTELPSDASLIYSTYLNLLQGKRVLIVADDIPDDEYLQRVLPPLGCALIITSRKQLKTGHIVDLGVLDRSQSVQLLELLCTRISANEGEQLAEICGNLPIALRVAGGLLKQYNTVNVKTYLKELQKPGRSRKLELDEIIGYSVKKLTKHQRTAFYSLSIMPSDFDRDAAIAIGSIRVNELPNSLDILVALHLILYEPGASRYYWHELLRDYAQIHIRSDTKNNASERHAQYYGQVSRKIYSLCVHKGESLYQGLAIFDRERIHFEAAFDFLDKNQKQEELANLVESLSQSIDLRFRSSDRIRWNEAYKKASAKTSDPFRTLDYFSGKNIARKIVADGNFGCAHAYAGNPEKAIIEFQKVLESARKMGNHALESQALNDLGSEYSNLGQVKEAVELHTKALVIAQEISDRLKEESAYGNLGVDYRRLGQNYRAIECFKNQLVIAKEIGEQREEAIAIMNIGRSYGELGKVKQSIQCYEDSILLFQKLKDRRSEGLGLLNLGGAYLQISTMWWEQFCNMMLPYIDLSRFSKVETAIRLCKEALEILEKEEAVRYLSNALTILGSAYIVKKQYTVAIGHLEKAQEIAQRTKDRRMEAGALLFLGKCYTELGESEKALWYADQSKKIFQEIGSPGVKYSNSIISELNRG